jgi:hypothetical protein
MSLTSRILLLASVFQVTSAISHLRREEPCPDSLYEEGADNKEEVNVDSVASALMEEMSTRMNMIQEAYGGHDSFYGVQKGLYSREIDSNVDELLAKADAWNKDGDGAKKEGHTAGIYGEIRPAGMVRMLHNLSVAPQQMFLDLGSGAGKFPIIASQIFGMNAKGIELVPKRHTSGCGAIEKLRSLAETRGESTEWSSHMPLGSLQLLQGSFFDYDVSDADVIFMDSVEWSDDMMQRLGQMFQGLKPGSKVMTWKDLPANGFKDGFIREGSISVPVTWQDYQDDAWQVYKKVSQQDKTYLSGKSSFADGDTSCVY